MNFNPEINGQDQEIIGQTSSVCPVCLEKVPAEKVKVGDNVYLRKTCEAHGDFQTIIWRGKPDYLAWEQEKKPEYPKVSLTQTEKGCPFDCGLCPRHSQQICCALLEVTQRCNLRCPVCFADAGTGSEPPLERFCEEGAGDRQSGGNQIRGNREERTTDPSREELLARLKMIWQTTGKCNIQLSGGEPTVRDDLPDIIRAAGSLGYTFFQLNTNGLRLAEDPDYVRALKEAGLSTVFLQFDGTKDEIYRRLRGRELFAIKQKAIENCGRRQLGVVLVPTLVPGINTDQIGEIARYALKGLPTIRGVHFQPVSYFGRYPFAPEDKDRITLPEVLRALEAQTGELLKVADFAPSDCENALCSFHGDFIYLEDGKLTPVTKKESNCCSQSSPGRQEEAVTKAQNFVAKRWQIHEGTACCAAENETKERDSWDMMLDRIKNYRLSITCMTFQDAENMDLERLQYCCVPVIDSGRAIPFCAYNLTNRNGYSLYRGKGKK
jgi:uncharacterized radical SAM superfamily Fe-S cluster-containing enzyme